MEAEGEGDEDDGVREGGGGRGGEYPSSPWDREGSPGTLGGLTSFSTLNSGWLTEGPVVEGVSLRVYPCYANGSLLPPKVLHPDISCNSSKSVIDRDYILRWSHYYI